MTAMISEVYDALLEAGASQEKARRAAEAMAGYESRFSSLEQSMTELKGQLGLVKWMVGFNLAITVAVLFRLFTT